MGIEVTRTQEGALADQVWNFSASCRTSGDEVELRLTDYVTRARATKRHKMAVIDCWRNYNRRVNTIETPPIPADVVEEALGKITYALVLPTGERREL